MSVRRALRDITKKIRALISLNALIQVKVEKKEA
jgi:hypothetical protein